MENLIQPNLHPLIVHFTIAFLTTGPILLFVSSFLEDKTGWQRDMRIVGDWMLALGVFSALAALAAGLQAYYSVNHDGPSHLAMTDHRNWAFGTTSLLIVFLGWRFTQRYRPPSKLFASLLLIPMLLIGITGWKGGHLVYQYGLGVSSLPVVSGDGHDHDHAEGEGHGAASLQKGGVSDQAPSEMGSSQADTGHDHASPHPDVPTSENELHGHDLTETQSEPNREVHPPEPAEHDHSGHEH